MYYDVEICVKGDFVYVVSEVFGKIPVPPDMAEAVRLTNDEFLKMVCDVRTALESDDTKSASKIVDAMEERWGARQTMIRSLRWQIFEYSADFEE